MTPPYIGPTRCAVEVPGESMICRPATPSCAESAAFGIVLLLAVLISVVVGERVGPWGAR